MTPERWQLIKSLLEQVELATTAERPALLERLANGDHQLQAKVLELLSDGGDSFLVNAIGSFTADIFASRENPIEGRVGHYQIIRRIGQGGMGSVYEAVRLDDFRKTVAIKIIKQEFDSDFARTRFQQERQLLAVLEHPYIARLIDGGESEDGRPYLVLEFVDGQPLADYCQPLDRTARLRLFLKVCEAVEFAHRNLIIHRDLKPGNILVTAEGDPKLLDFGIAKLIDPSATLTQTSLMAMTPDYASPEQVRGGPISTASDIYSLGVILYQILTGRKPYSLDSASAVEMDRVICVEAPAPPGLGDELDYILMMALRKEPDRRYPTVRQFADDIERYLTNRTVLARPDTLRYRVTKFTRRNWLALTAASITLAAILTGSLVAVHQARVAQQRFQQVRKLANTFLFQFHDSIANIPGTTKARELVVTTALEYLDNLLKSGGPDDDLKLELAQAYERVAVVQGLPQTANLGDFTGAKSSFTKAVALYDQVGRRDTAYRKAFADCLAKVAYLDVYQGDLKSARAEAARAATVLEPLRQNRDPGSLAMVARLYDTLGAIGYQSDLDFAEDNLRKGLGQWEEWAKAAPESEGAAVPYRLSVSHARLGKTRAGKGWLQDGAREELLSLRFGEEAARRAPSNSTYQRNFADDLVTLAALYGSEDGAGLNQPAEAARYARQAVEVLAPLAAADAHDQAIQENYAMALMCLGQALSVLKPPLGIEEASRGMQIWRGLREAKRLSAFEERGRLSQMHGWIRVLTRHGRAAEATVAAETLVADRRLTLAGKPPESEYWWDLVADLCLASVTARAGGHSAQAHALAQQALELSRRFLPTAASELTTGYDAALVYLTLAQDREALGNCAEAQEWRTKERELWRGMASKSDYAPVRLRAAESSLSACAVH